MREDNNHTKADDCQSKNLISIVSVELQEQNVPLIEILIMLGFQRHWKLSSG